MATHPGSRWLDANWPRLPRGFWVAANSGGIVAENRDLNDVFASLARQNIDPANVTIAYVPEGVVQ